MCLNDHQTKSSKWPKMARITLRMAIFSIFGDFLALKPSPFFQMGEISASVRHEARSDRGQKVPAKKNGQKVLNMAILVHIMAIFPVFQDIEP